MGKKVARLAVHERVSVDQRRVGDIVSELGETAAQRLIQSALEHLAMTLRDTVAAAAEGDLARVVAHADRLSRLAWQVGLLSLARVALDVAHCAEAANHASLSATLARLERVGNGSLLEIWDADIGEDG